MGRFILILVLGFFVSIASGADTEEEVQPPFGLRWGEEAPRLQSLLKGAKATVIDKTTNSDQEIWTVEGIVQNALRRTLFYLQRGRLIQVELQYQSADWDTNKYESFMTSIRQRLDGKYGPGQMIARSKTPQGQVMQTLVGYKWNKPNTNIRLIYFSAEDADKIFRTVSIHYHGLPSSKPGAP